MLNKYVLLFLFFAPALVSGQNCNLSFSGSIDDLSTGKPISFASIYIEESGARVIADSLGFFNIESMCAGEYHISISHIGCETKELFLNITNDTIVNILLDHNSHFLNEVAIVGPDGKVTTEENQTLNAESIVQNMDKNLATMLENISGVSTIKNGSGIAKPVVHGLYGNRLSILNNGIAQSGQQWGVDHSPEIDPLVANKITVIKGVGSLEYQGSSLGSVILVEPKKIDHDPHLHGEGRYFFESNGVGNGLNLEMQQYGKFLAWRIVGTLKKSGDKKTSKYFLRNTGGEEGNLAIQLEKSWRKKWFSDLYMSSFNTKLGVLRGAHIGNLTDLESALERDVPFFTEDSFSYSIESPYQKVNHHLLKFHTKYLINEKQWIDFTYAGQYDLRKEFDVRRSGRSDKPALSLEQFSHFFEGKYQNQLPRHWKLKSGIQFNRVDNTNLPETGILPLIPDYISYEYGLFALLSKSFDQTVIEFGGRFDSEFRNVATISMSVPREILRYQNEYQNLSAMVGVKHQFAKDWKVVYNIGFASRNPEINELYSNGLHQGVSGIEEGDPTLNAEISIKNTLSLKGVVKNRLTVEGLVYHQNINDYIFLNPQNEIRLTIRGAFPVFKYEQTDARLFGCDIAASYAVNERLNITGKYSFLDGFDVSNNLPLVFMPSNNLYAALDYQIPEVGKFQHVEFQINNRFVFEQNNLDSEQDFVAPPSSYYLLGLKVSAAMQLRKHRLKMFVKAENLLNETYRNYLNRQRYFADDLGFNLIVGFSFEF